MTLWQILQLINRPAAEENKEESDKQDAGEDNKNEWGEFLHLPGQKFFDFNKIFSSVVVEKDNKECRYDWQIIGDETGIAFALFETRDSIDFKFHTKYHFDNRLFIDLTNGENHGSYQQLHLRSK